MKPMTSSAPEPRAIDVLLLGAGGHARVLLEVLRQQPSVSVLGILERDQEKWGKKLEGIKVLGTDDHIFAFNSSRVQLVNGLGSTHLPTARKAVFERWKQRGYTFYSVVHSSAVISTTVVLGEGVQVLALSSVNTGAFVGANSLINTGAIVEHDCQVGSHVHLATGARLAGNVHVGSGCHIGAGATLIQGVTIGAETVIGAGAVVTVDIAPRSVAVGVPAKIIKRL